MKKTLVLPLLILLASACSTPEYALNIEGEPPPVRPEISLVRGTKGKIEYAVKYSVIAKEDDSRLDFIRSITTGNLYLYDRNGFIDSTELLLIGGSKRVNDSMYDFTLTAEDYWVNALGRDFGTVHCVVVLNAAGNKRYVVKESRDLSADSEENRSVAAVEVEPIIEVKSDSLVTFAVLAKRHRSIEDYFPNSERLRVEILSPKGKLVWASNDGKMYMMALGAVEPRMPNYTKRYELDWDGRAQDGSRLPYGTYTVNFSLPVKPHAYTATKEFVWKGANE